MRVTEDAAQDKGASDHDPEDRRNDNTPRDRSSSESSTPALPIHRGVLADNQSENGDSMSNHEAASDNGDNSDRNENDVVPIPVHESLPSLALAQSWQRLAQQTVDDTKGRPSVSVRESRVFVAIMTKS